MRKLNKLEASKLLSIAAIEAVTSHTRLGQCIMNNLPKDMYDELTGTDNDFFYEENETKAYNMFLGTCVEESK